MRAASFATVRNLALTPLVADFRRFPADALQRRGGYLVEQADAAVIVRDDRDPAVRRVLALVERKGIPVHVIGAPEKQKVRKVRALKEPEPTSRVLPNLA